MKKIVAGFGTAILASCGLFGQTAPPPAFEVASVQPAVLWERPGISGGQEVVLRADVHLVEVSIVATDAKGARARKKPGTVPNYTIPLKKETRVIRHCPRFLRFLRFPSN